MDNGGARLQQFKEILKKDFSNNLLIHGILADDMRSSYD